MNNKLTQIEKDLNDLFSGKHKKISCEESKITENNIYKIINSINDQLQDETLRSDIEYIEYYRANNYYELNLWNSNIENPIWYKVIKTKSGNFEVYESNTVTFANQLGWKPSYEDVTEWKRNYDMTRLDVVKKHNTYILCNQCHKTEDSILSWDANDGSSKRYSSYVNAIIKTCIYSVFKYNFSHRIIELIKWFTDLDCTYKNQMSNKDFKKLYYQKVIFNN